MNRLFACLSVAFFLTGASAAHADEAAPQLAQPGKLLFQDDFNRAEVGDAWNTMVSSGGITGQSKLVDGVLSITRNPKAGHAAVCNAKLDHKDVIFSLRYCLTGPNGFTLNMNAQDCKESHAGHIANTIVKGETVRIQDQKLGSMNLKVMELKQTDPAAAEKAQQGKFAEATFASAPGTWHDLLIEVVGDEMLVTIDGKPADYLQSPGIAHPTKSNIAFNVPKEEVRFDDFKVYEATRSEQWAQKKEQVLKQIKPRAASATPWKKAPATEAKE